MRSKILASVLGLGLAAPALLAAAPAASPLSAELETLRAKYDFPAVAGAIFDTDGVLEQAAVGTRRRGSKIAATMADQWLLGSDSKAMTALLVGTYVAGGKLKWSTPVASFFPEWAAQIPAPARGITIGDVLSHSAGLKDNLDWFALARRGTVAEQRQAAARQLFLAPEFQPGAFHYSNGGYVLIAALLERMTGRSWEELMTERVFQPLHMTSAGFSRAAGADRIDQPWPHRGDGRPVVPTDFTSARLALGEDELPPLLAPAGLVHCSVADWARFLSDQLRGAAGLPALLPAPIYHAMQTARPGSPYGYGWGVGERPWAGGKILEHEGSDGLNYCICLLAPEKKFGVLVCTNQGGGNAQRLCDEVVTLLVERHLAAGQPGLHP